MRKGFFFAAIVETLTGLSLIIAPVFVGQLLFGVAFSGVALTVARVTGIALIALGISCWPGKPNMGMLIYSVLITLYLAYLGFAGGMTGILLWPVVILHLILSVLLCWEFTKPYNINK